MLRQGRLQGQQRHYSTLDICHLRPRICRRPPCLPAAPSRVQTRPLAAAAAEAELPAADIKPRVKRPGRKKAPEEDNVEEQGMLDLPVPLDYQQTLIKSFTLGGIGLHTADYAVVRVRPAFAGEGRYFVRVPEGTNASRFVFDGGNVLDEVPEEMAGYVPPVPEEVEDLKVEWYLSYLAAQEEEGFVGTFDEFLAEQVRDGGLELAMMKELLDIRVDEETQPAVEPDLSLEPEDIVALDPDDPTLVRANIVSVYDTDLPFTQLGVGDNRVMNVELLLAALEACGVDNARIEMEGGHEIPVLDNCALGWCVDIQCAGLRAAPARPDGPVPGAAAAAADDLVVVQRDLIRTQKAVAVQDEDGWISFFPGPFTKLTGGVDHSLVAPVIGSQWYTWHTEDVHFRYSLAPARAYVESVEELFAMRDAGYVKAGAENLFIVAHGDKWWDPSMVRMVYDEPVRHKLTRLIGNLALLGMNGNQGIPVGHITAFNASTSLQLAFVSMMLGAIEDEDYVSLATVIEEQEQWLVDKYGPEEEPEEEVVEEEVEDEYEIMEGEVEVVEGGSEEDDQE